MQADSSFRQEIGEVRAGRPQCRLRELTAGPPQYLYGPGCFCITQNAAATPVILLQRQRFAQCSDRRLARGRDGYQAASVRKLRSLGRGLLDSRSSAARSRRDVESRPSQTSRRGRKGGVRVLYWLGRVLNTAARDSQGATRLGFTSVAGSTTCSMQTVSPGPQAR